MLGKLASLEHYIVLQYWSVKVCLASSMASSIWLSSLEVEAQDQGTSQHEKEQISQLLLHWLQWIY